MSMAIEYKKLTLFDGVSAEAVERLLNDPRNACRTYKKGEYIALQGQPCRSLYMLVKGTLHATMTNADGKELVIERLSAPELLAPAFAFGDENRFPVNLMPMETCEVRIINKESFLRFLHDEPLVMERFIAQIANRCVFLSRKLNEFALQSLRFRVINYLRKHGVIDNQQTVASQLGVARPSLARVLSEMLKEKSIKKEGNAIRLN